jgi:hypothetical protein
VQCDFVIRKTIIPKIAPPDSSLDLGLKVQNAQYNCRRDKSDNDVQLTTLNAQNYHTDSNYKKGPANHFTDVA